ncbi:MAG: chromate transporter, partial [Pseudomonadota bacterium]
MLDGLGLAETTPGPLILVTEFVGFLGAYRHGGEPALAYGLLGAAVTLWATFAPCFLWIFTGAPYVEQLRANPKLAGALRGVTAAVVGVILNLSLWFALHVIFKTVTATDMGPLRFWAPELASFQWDAALLAVLAALLIFGARLGILTTLAICAGASLTLSALL